MRLGWSLCFSSEWSPVTVTAVSRSRGPTTLGTMGSQPQTLDWNREHASCLMKLSPRPGPSPWPQTRAQPSPPGPTLPSPGGGGLWQVGEHTLSHTCCWEGQGFSLRHLPSWHPAHLGTRSTARSASSSLTIPPRAAMPGAGSSCLSAWAASPPLRSSLR